MLTVRASWVRGLLGKLTGTPFALTLWDNKTTRYGSGKPKFHLKILKPEVINELLQSPQLGFGEAYLAGDLELEGDLGALIALALENQEKFARLLKSAQLIRSITSRLNRPTSLRQQKKDIARHYDLGNDFYKLWLDKQMVYSCAYFKTKGDTLEQAQQQKIDHTLAKLQLKRGERLLDVGSGWGALIINAAKRYGVRATGITLSSQQVAWTRRRIKQEGLGRLVNVEYLDYREMPRSWYGAFDKWVSIGMFEHVGQANHQAFMSVMARLLKPSGLGLLHSITSQVPTGGTFFQKYIFPGGYLPNLSGIIEPLEQQGCLILDVENLMRHYGLTLDQWARRFEQNAAVIQAMYGERFVRMWRLYLTGSAQLFHHGRLQVCQILFANSASIPKT